MPQSIESMMVEIQERLTRLESSLPARIDAAEISSAAKLPFKALWYRESLIWRMTELSRIAFDSFQNDKLASAIILTRAAVETNAATWYLHKNLAATVASKAVGNIDECLKRLLMGTRDVDRGIMPEAINVMTFVRHVDKEIPGFSHQYDALSEYAHPNWAGTALLYSNPDPPKFRVEFGAHIRGGDNTKLIGRPQHAIGIVVHAEMLVRHVRPLKEGIHRPHERAERFESAFDLLPRRTGNPVGSGRTPGLEIVVRNLLVTPLHNAFARITKSSQQRLQFRGEALDPQCLDLLQESLEREISALACSCRISESAQRELNLVELHRLNGAEKRGRNAVQELNALRTGTVQLSIHRPTAVQPHHLVVEELPCI